MSSRRDLVREARAALADAATSSDASTLRGLVERLAAALEDAAGERSSARLLDAIVEHIPHMIFVKDADQLAFQRFNRAGEELLGLRREELIGKTDVDLFPPDEAAFFQAKDRQTLAGKTIVDIPEEPIQTRGGARWLHTKKVPILDDDGRPLHLLGISEDITDRRRLDELVRKEQEAREELANELEAFTYSVSHDLRAPLRALQGYARILIDEHAARFEGDGRFLVDGIHRNAVQMGRLVDDLLHFARTGRQVPRATAFQMTPLVEAIVADLRAAEPARAIDVTVDALPDAVGDPSLLRQVWANLLENAFKYTRPRTRARIHVRAHRDGDQVRYEVVDDGVGFDMRFHDKLFEVFQRLHRPDDFEGTGVGLALVHRIVTRHGGRVWAEGTVGVGATFGFSLPAA